MTYHPHFKAKIHNLKKWKVYYEQIKSFIYIPHEPQPNLICKHNIYIIMPSGNFHIRTSHTLLWVFLTFTCFRYKTS